MRLLLLVLGLAALVLIPFAIWGADMEAAFTLGGTTSWMASYGQWAWAAGIALLVLDLVLPVPSTVVMSALGYLYGPVWGGLASMAGSFLAGSTGYGLCRAFGVRAARRLLGEEDLARGAALFERSGGWLVVLSRWLPVLQEVVACMAGLTRMRARTFFLAMACGAGPMGFTFAAVGATGVDHPLVAAALSVILPALLWIGARPLLNRAKQTS